MRVQTYDGYLTLFIKRLDFIYLYLHLSLTAFIRTIIVEFSTHFCQIVNSLRLDTLDMHIHFAARKQIRQVCFPWLVNARFNHTFMLRVKHMRKFVL